jgi:predicted nuclease of predicted toxin-antitoxin system
VKVLLDECVPKDFCKSFPEHECHTAHQAGFGGKTNGDLLTAAERAGFEVLITVDRNMPHQQNLPRHNLALIILIAPSNDLDNLLPHAAACLRALRSVGSGQILQIGAD